MKHAIIGTLLILYGLFLTPCFVEPSDIVISTAWLVAATAAGIPIIVITLWMISGYIAVIIGAALLGHFIFRRVPAIASSVSHPIALVLFIVSISVICLWFIYIA